MSVVKCLVDIVGSSDVWVHSTQDHRQLKRALGSVESGGWSGSGLFSAFHAPKCFKYTEGSMTEIPSVKLATQILGFFLFVLFCSNTAAGCSAAKYKYGGVWFCAGSLADTVTPIQRNDDTNCISRHAGCIEKCTVCRQNICMMFRFWLRLAVVGQHPHSPPQTVHSPIVSIYGRARLTQQLLHRGLCVLLQSDPSL